MDELSPHVHCWYSCVDGKEVIVYLLISVEQYLQIEPLFESW